MRALAAGHPLGIRVQLGHGLERAVVDDGAADLLDVRVPGGTITEVGLRSNVGVAIEYLESWLRGVGAVTIANLMEDTATAEIARSQVWQWVHHGARLTDGRTVDRNLARQVEDDEIARLRAAVGETTFATRRFDEARALIDELVLSESLADFLTLQASERLR